MIQLTPQMRFFVAVDPVDFRRGIDGLVRVCRYEYDKDPFSGVVFICRNRKGSAVKILVYDGQGYWLCQKRLSKGRFQHWPKTEQEARGLTSGQINVLLWNGNPLKSCIQPDWKKIA